jgi:glucokinase
MYLGIEIGGTKLQLGVGSDGSELLEVCRMDIDPDGQAMGILRQIERTASDLAARHQLAGVGIGFGGPVDTRSGRVIRSHQVDGWENVELARWCSRIVGVPAVLGNDCDTAALAEARYGAGRGCRSVFFVTAGTGVGGGYVVDGQLQGAGRPAVAEIGHLRPGLQADRSDMTVESMASGWGIAAAAKARIQGNMTLRLASRPETVLSAGTGPGGRIDRPDIEHEFRRELLDRCDGDLDQLTAKQIACAAGEGNQLALDVIRHATDVLGWAIAQTVTLLAPDVVVVGGGVSLMGESLFFAPLRDAVSRYVFPPLADAFEVVPAALGELVVVHGAIALAARRTNSID